MIAIAALLLTFLAFMLFALAVFLALEVIASFGARAKPEETSAAGARAAIVIPAHDEAAGIRETIQSLAGEHAADDRVLVVADNCTDDTASVARNSGAIAIERNDAQRRGKGYALQFGVDHLRDNPPDVVIFVDADCIVERGALKRISAAAMRLDRPVQALYLMRPPTGAGPKHRVSAFAWLLMNRVRMAGLQELAGVTRLTGAGMAFPWSLIATMDLASGEIVEDLAMTIRLVERKSPPVLDLGAVVVSELARSDKGAAIQRARWEQGSIRMALRAAPRLLARGVAGDRRALALALDIAIPPLAAFGAMLALAIAVSAPLALLGHAEALKLSLAAAFVAALAVAGAWAAHGQSVLPARSLGGIVGYIGSKARIYGAEGRQSTKAWRRTDRGEGDAP